MPADSPQRFSRRATSLSGNGLPSPAFGAEVRNPSPSVTGSGLVLVGVAVTGGWLGVIVVFSGEFIGGVPARLGVVVAGGGTFVAGLFSSGVPPVGGAGLVVSKAMPPLAGGVTTGG